MRCRFILVAFAVVVLTSCATQKFWVATGGSRSDGTVRLAYDYGEFEAPQLDAWQGLNTARSRCEAWGYSGADAFGGDERHCTLPGGMSGCMQWTVTREYQCTGSLEKK